jgi:hypothetical protein
MIMILSGPKAMEATVKAALKSAGLDVHGSTVDHLLPDCVDGSRDPAVGFVSVEGDDVDAPNRAVDGLGWTLRAHYNEPKMRLDLGVNGS